MAETQTSSAPSPSPYLSDLHTRVLKHEQGAADFQSRRHPDWREIYSLYRDKVQTNRLTQRQSVNVPVMKETVKAVLSKIDEFPDLYFESLSGDKQKEIFTNELWQWWFREDAIEVKDIQDKKQVILYGRSVMKLNLHPEGRPTVEVLEPYDWLCDRFADPADIDGTAGYQAHIHLYSSIDQLEADPLGFDKPAVQRIRERFARSMGLIAADQNVDQTTARDQRLEDMGQFDMKNPEIGAAIVERREHYVKVFDADEGREVIHLYITCEGEVLFDRPLEDILAINFFPFVTWADDVEKTDIWSDGIGDVVRTPNKVLNAWMSQLVENRTLRNFGMTLYDATQGDGKWIPQSYEPVPWGWYPTAGDPNKTTKRVDIPDLSESIDEMNFMIGVVERATAATATEKGVETRGEATLGEVKLMLANSNQRITSIAKFYRIARRELGEKWYKLMEANAKHFKPVKLFKKSYKDNYFGEEVTADDWKDELGYSCRVVSSAEREQKNFDTLQRLQGVRSMFPGNKPLERILKKKSLDILDLSAEEQDEVLNYEEERNVDTGNPADPNVVPTMPESTPAPVAPVV